MNRRSRFSKHRHIEDSAHPGTYFEPGTDEEPLWTLDFWLVALSGLVLYIIVTKLSFSDPRWLYNGFTYAVAVPLVALLLALAMHKLASGIVQKSVQIGFLFSVFVHLLLLVLAVNVVIFSQFFPEAFTGVKPERSPIRKTVPEYLFQTPKDTTKQPDWSQPVDATTASRVIPKELRQLPPVENSTPEIEMPRPPDPEQRPMQQFLLKRQTPEKSEPKPADSPAKLARQELSSATQSSPETATPVAPQLESQANDNAKANAPERAIAKESPKRTESKIKLEPLKNTPQPNMMAMLDRSQSAATAIRRRTQAMPKVGELGLASQNRPRVSRETSKPVGASPSPRTIPIAKEMPNADRMISPIDVPLKRSGKTQGAQLAQANDVNVMSLPSNERPSARRGKVERRDLSALAGLPDISSGQSQSNQRSRAKTGSDRQMAPAGTPTLSEAIAEIAATQANAPTESAGDRAEVGMRDFSRRQSSASGSLPMNSPNVQLGPKLDILADNSVAGLTNRPMSIAGVIPSDEMLDIGSLEINRERRERKQVGGPVTPVGAEVTAVESFNRRMMRTQGGAAPAPAGLVGPATEEAIELGLAYLAESQNPDGSWSLQGHGEDVMLRSDTAATGLCLLAFQGAGYTHRQHQYADTVSRGIKFLIDNQKTNGDLYKNENRLSDQNVAFYSHGIASLAMCEAYGMTQDEELKEAAQACLNFIGKTQHNRLGGWRYTAQVSSDTSVSGWMMMALKSGELSGLDVPEGTYQGIDRWLDYAQQSASRPDRYRYNPFAANTPAQRHGRKPTPTMTAVGMLMRMYSGWRRDHEAMQSAAEYLLESPPQMGTERYPRRDGYYWYYATQVMFHMGGDYWERWNRFLNPLLLESQIKNGPMAGSWDPLKPVEDRWSVHGGRLYVTTMNLLNLEVYYRHLPIYEETAE